MIQIWSGIYSRWDEAVAIADAEDEPVFAGTEWLHKVTSQLLEYRAQLHQHGVALPPRPSNLPLVTALTEPEVIVDLGGSSGWCWDYLRTSVPGNKIRSYQVIETSSIVDFFTDSDHHDEPVSFHTTTNGLGDCDLLYVNSVLQYFPSNSPLAEVLADVVPKYVLLDDLFAGDIPEFFSVQNYYGKRIPCRFMSFTALSDDLLRNGYRLVFKVPFDTPTLGVSQTKPMDNFPSDHRLRYSLAALFIRA